MRPDRWQSSCLNVPLGSTPSIPIPWLYAVTAGPAPRPPRSARPCELDIACPTQLAARSFTDPSSTSSNTPGWKELVSAVTCLPYVQLGHKAQRQHTHAKTAKQHSCFCHHNFSCSHVFLCLESWTILCILCPSCPLTGNDEVPPFQMHWLCVGNGAEIWKFSHSG